MLKVTLNDLMNTAKKLDNNSENPTMHYIETRTFSDGSGHIVAVDTTTNKEMWSITIDNINEVIDLTFEDFHFSSGNAGNNKDYALLKAEIASEIPSEIMELLIKCSVCPIQI